MLLALLLGSWAGCSDELGVEWIRVVKRVFGTVIANSFLDRLSRRERYEYFAMCSFEWCTRIWMYRSSSRGRLGGGVASFVAY